MGKRLWMLWLAMAVAVAGGGLCARGEEDILIDGETIEVSFADGDGLSGKVDDTYRDRYTNAKAQILTWNGVGLQEIEVLENEAEWPDFQFTPSVSDPVIRLILVRQGGGEHLSDNAVGYVKREVPAGKWQIVSIPYGNIAADDRLYKFGDTQMANDLPQGSSVQFWDETTQAWSGGSKGAKGWLSPQALRVLGTGEAFFVQNNSGGALEVTLAGEVPAAGTLSRDYAEGKWSIMASMYPVPVKFGDTELAGQLPQGSAVLFWDAGKQGWSGGLKSAKGWAPAQANQVVGAGEGFFVKSPSAGTWVQGKPYAGPGNDE